MKRALLVLSLTLSGCTIDVARPSYSRAEIDAQLAQVAQVVGQHLQVLKAHEERIEALEPKKEEKK